MSNRYVNVVCHGKKTQTQGHLKGSKGLIHQSTIGKTIFLLPIELLSERVSFEMALRYLNLFLELIRPNASLLKENQYYTQW
jgi:hypothetical protein